MLCLGFTHLFNYDLVSKLSVPGEGDAEAPKNLGGRRGSSVNLQMLASFSDSSTSAPSSSKPTTDGGGGKTKVESGSLE